MVIRYWRKSCVLVKGTSRTDQPVVDRMQSRSAQQTSSSVVVKPRRAMEQVLELDEANEIVRWSSRPCEGRPEGSGRTQGQPALLVSIPNRRRIQDRRLRNRCADACVNSGITHADRTAAREQEIQSLKEALKILES